MRNKKEVRSRITASDNINLRIQIMKIRDSW